MHWQPCSGLGSHEAGMQADQVAETLSTCRFAQRMMQARACRKTIEQRAECMLAWSAAGMCTASMASGCRVVQWD